MPQLLFSVWKVKIKPVNYMLKWIFTDLEICVMPRKPGPLRYPFRPAKRLYMQQLASY